MAKPTNEIDWVASTHGESEPIGAKKTAGWEDGEYPPAPNWNWFWKLVSQWIAWLSSVGKNSDSEVISYPEATGMRGGFYFEDNVMWHALAGTITNTTGFVIDNRVAGKTTGTNTLIYGDDAEVYPFPYATIEAGTSSDNEYGVIYGSGDAAADDEHFTKVLDDVVVVMEWAMLLDTIPTDNPDVYMGLSSGGNIGLRATIEATDHAMFRRKGDATGWTMMSSGSAGADTDEVAGTEPVVNVWQTFRIEYHGMDTAEGDGVDPTIKFYIDGVLEATHAAGPSGSNSLGFFFMLNIEDITPTIDGASMFISPVKIRWVPWSGGYNPGQK